jgi:MoaA/NifB/PqqE/SkfB family radical SAM enzyme
MAKKRKKQPELDLKILDAYVDLVAECGVESLEYLQDIVTERIAEERQAARIKKQRR